MKHIRKGVNLMKYLKIERDKGYYCIQPDIWQEIDKINKDELLILLDKAIETEFEMDEYEISKLGNKAHQIIYRNLYSKFSELLENKSRFKGESEQLYRSGIEKYQEKVKPDE